MYILRHYVYDGTVFNLRDYSKNLTFDNVKIFGSSGMAYICEDNSSHFQIINNFIGVNPGKKESRCVSLTADAIHIVNTNGCFNISGCYISGNTVYISEFFEKSNEQGRIFMYDYCSNITYSDNEFVKGGFLNSKKIIQSDNISVWAEVNSQL